MGLAGRELVQNASEPLPYLKVKLDKGAITCLYSISNGFN